MSQAATWGVPQTSPATPSAYAIRDQASLDALMTTHRGAARPAYLTTGFWIDDSAGAASWKLYFWDGAQSILCGTINTTANTYTSAGARLDNIVATTNPTTGDDSADGYSVGSLWVNVTAQEAYVCVSATVGAAVWLNTTLTAAELGTLAFLSSVANSNMATMAANTVKANATASTATPTDVALAASRLLGRGSSGNIAAISTDSTLAFTGAVLGAVLPTQREVLTGNRDYYVLTTGNDSNTGLVNTAGGAFLTIQKAFNVIKGLDLNGFVATINVGNGTYTGAIVVDGHFVGAKGPESVVLLGNNGSPGSAIISTTSADAVKGRKGAKFSISGFKIQTTTTGNGLVAEDNGTKIDVINLMQFGACAGLQIYATKGGAIQFSTNYTINGNFTCHWATDSFSYIQAANLTITLTGTPVASSNFALCAGGRMAVGGNTFSGAGSGTRYSVTQNGILDTVGGGATYLPGSVAGSTATGGQYL